MKHRKEKSIEQRMEYRVENMEKIYSKIFVRIKYYNLVLHEITQTRIWNSILSNKILIITPNPKIFELLEKKKKNLKFSKSI